MTDKEDQGDRLKAYSVAFPDLAFILDRDGRHLDYLAGAHSEELLYGEPAEFMGRTAHEVLPSDVADRIVSQTRAAIDAGEPQQVEYSLDLPQGERWFEARIEPLPFQVESTEVAISVVRDITTRKQHESDLRGTRERMEQALQITDAVVWEWDIKADTVTTHPSPHILFDAEINTEEDFLDLIHPDDRSTVEDAIGSALETDEPYAIEYRIQDDGTVRWIEDYGEVELDETGVPGRMRGVARDITSRKEREAELRRQNERLDEFASIVSHDLRNPLSVAAGRLELAREEPDEVHFDAIERAHERMAALIDDLLTLARQGEEVRDVEPIELARLTEQCWRNVATTEATLTIDIERPIQADRNRLQQLLENLIRNAVEHGGDDVTVTVGKLEDGFYVEDDGPGIPEDNLEEVFDAGFSTSEEGTGFGLSIVKQVADAHGWSVSVSTGSYGGARFEVSGVEFTED